MADRRRETVKAPIDRYTPLDARLDEMELRIRMLEARLRETTTELEKARAAATPKKGKGAATKKAGPPKARCGGCMLELPKGHRDEHCVWCGFFLPAVKTRLAR